MLHETLDRKFNEELQKNEYRPYLLQRIFVYTRFMRVTAGFTGMALSFFVIPPLVVYLKYKKLIQIYQGKYPFAVEPGSGLYWAIIAMESSSMPLAWFVISGTDNAFGLHGFRLCGLLRGLAQRYRGLRPNQPDYRIQLAECVQTHRLLLRSRDALQRVYGPIVLWIYLTSAVIMCSILYQLKHDKKRMTMAKLIFFTSYISLKLLQSFTYAYYGALVAQESEKCRNAVYDCNWAGSGDVQLMKDMLIVQMQQTIVLKANGFFVVTMSMFEKILNTTLSYFCLLQTIDE